MKVFLCSLLIAVSVFAQQPPVSRLALDDLKIEVTGASQPVVYTNGAAGALFTETKAALRSSSPGWRVMGAEMMKDYAFRIGGTPLQREDAVRVLLYPHQITRVYPGGMEETVTMLDSINAFIIQLKHVHDKTVTLYPLYGESHDDADFSTGFDRNVMLIARNSHM